MIFINLYSCSWYIYTKDFSHLKTDKRDIFEIFMRFKSVMQHYVCSYSCYLDTDLVIHGPFGIEASCASTEPENNLRVNLIVKSNIGFLLEFVLYSNELS